jgi:hypothetical protein
VPLSKLAVLLKARGRMNWDKRLVWTPYPFPRGGAEADVWDGLYLAFRASHGTAIKSGIPMVGYVVGVDPHCGDRFFHHVAGGELLLSRLHNYCLIRAIGAFEPGAMAPTGYA